MTLDDELATGTTRAKNQAGLYQELRNCQMSDALRQHVTTRLTQLQQINPTISPAPLGTVHLGANHQPPPHRAEQRCEKCFEVHAGECL